MRADKYFAVRYGTRTKAAQALNSGLVLRDGRALKPSDEVTEGEFTFLEPSDRFVSNGGRKLARGLDVFGESVQGGVYADLGASTGGFTDCLLQRGASHVFCVDVGSSQLAAELAADKRVTVMDNTNARYLTRQDFSKPLDGVVSDLSFISLRLVLPAIAALLNEGGKAFVLFKPQFECEGRHLGKSGILPPRYHGALLKEFYEFAVALSLAPRGVVHAPIREKKNIEYIVFLQKDAEAVPQYLFMQQVEKIQKI